MTPKLPKPARTSKRWSNEDKEYLRVAYLDGTNINEIAQIVQRTPDAVRKQIKNMKLHQDRPLQKWMPWRYEDDLYLHITATTTNKSVREMAEHLDRTITSVSTRLSIKGLHYHPPRREHY